MNPLLNPVFLCKLAKSYVFDVNRVRRLTDDEIRKYQDKCLRKIVNYVYKVPLYHRKYREAGVYPGDIKGIKDIERLPFVTKKDFRESGAKDLLPLGANVEDYSMVCTSGSTGKPVTLYSDIYTILYTFIGFIRILKEHDINWRKTRMAVIADLSPDSAEAAYLTKVALPWLRSFLSLSNMKVFHVGEKPEKLLKEIEVFNPEFVGGYPGVLKVLAVLKRQGRGKRLKPRIIGASGAILDDHTRDYIRKTFDAVLFDVYGATECSPIAFQCSRGSYHINSDFAYVEFMDAREKEEISGDGGNIVVTRLFGKGTPVVRYTGVNDLLLPSKRRCNCDINTPIIERIEGRCVDAIILPNGEMVPPSSITGIPHKVMHMFNTDKIQQFQIIQHSINEVEVLVVIDEKLRNLGPRVEELFEEIRKQFEEKLGEDIAIHVREVDKITMTRPGSAVPPVIISKVNVS
jgi:phenylacetate-CoA ligase